MAISGEGINVATFRNDIGVVTVRKGTHVTVSGNRAARIRERALERVLAVDRSRGCINDFLIYLISGVSRMSVQHEFTRAGTLDDMRSLALSVGPELAACLLRQDDPLIFPSRHVLRRIHRKAVEVVIRRGGKEVLAVHVVRAAHFDDASTVRVDRVAIRVHEGNACG